jgi:hypothetical protein
MDPKTVERCKGEVVERESEVVRLPKAGEQTKAFRSKELAISL